MDIFDKFDRNFKILAVDDEPQNLRLVKEILSSSRYEVFTASDGKEGYEKALQLDPDLVLLDVLMPGMDGYELCQQLKNDERTRLIPVIMVTALQELEDKIRGIEAGADDFLNKPFNVGEFVARVRASLRLKQITDELENAETVFNSLALGVEAKDPNTNGHCKRLADNSVLLGEKLGLNSSELKALKRGGILHDIGKLAIPDAILLNPNPLSQEERAIMQKHTTIGEEICEPLRKLRNFKLVLPIIRNHHERWDGGGYPDGLKGKEIPITARILQTVDVFDALCSQRPYKPPLQMKEVLNQVNKEAKWGWRDQDLIYEYIRMIEEKDSKLTFP